jgi:hypothetical protein
MGYMELTTVDYDGESSVVRFPCPDMTSSNIDGLISAGNTLALAFADITACVVLKKKFVAKTSNLSAVRRSDNDEAHREAKWLNRYYDATTFERYTLSTPGPLRADQDATDRGFADLTDTEVAAYKTAFEAFVQPGANAVALESMEWVGRNL